MTHEQPSTHETNETPTSPELNPNPEVVEAVHAMVQARLAIREAERQMYSFSEQDLLDAFAYAKSIGSQSAPSEIQDRDGWKDGTLDASGSALNAIRDQATQNYVYNPDLTEQENADNRYNASQDAWGKAIDYSNQFNS